MHQSRSLTLCVLSLRLFPAALSLQLNSEIRALLGQIGLGEGEAEQSVLDRFKGKELPHDPEEDDETGMIDDDDEEEEAMTPAERRAQAKAAKKALVVEQNAAAVAKQQAAKAAAQAAAAPANGKTATTPAAAPAVSLSRAKPVKEEPAARVKKGAAVKQEEADDEAAEDDNDAQQSKPVVQAKDAFPLNNPSLPAAAAPSTLPASASSAAALKWWDQAPHVTLQFPVATKSAASTGKKVALSGNGASSVGFVLPKTVEECHTLATERLAAVVEHFETVNAGRSSDARWLSTVMTSGTLSDKVAGMTLMIQESPLYRLGILDKLLAMARKQGRRENGMAIDALKDLFTNDLLPPGRKLVSFAAQPFFKSPRSASNPAPSETQLTYWMLEDSIKSRYMDFLSILEEGTHDEMSYIKKARLMQLNDLLLASPEREKVILALLVNKMGDADKKIASRVVFLLTEIIKTHPGFKLSLIVELEQLLYRAHIAPRAQYYAIIFLNQMVFAASGEEALANKLIAVYFLLFKQFITNNKKEREAELEIEAKRAAKKRARAKQQAEAGHKPYRNKKDSSAPPPKKYGGSNSVKSLPSTAGKKGFVSVEASDALRSKLLGGLLTGINRALPYASPMAVEGDGAPVDEKPASATSASTQSGASLVWSQIDMLFNLVHTTSFNTSIQALMLLYQVLSKSIAAGGGPNTDRFYRALYDKILAPELNSGSTGGGSGSAKHGLFLNLLFKSMKHDTNSERVAAFAKRICQICLNQAPTFICGCLFLLSEIMKSQQGLRMLVSQPPAHSKLKPVGKPGTTGSKAENQEEDDEEEEHFVDAPEDGEEAAVAAVKSEPAAADGASDSTAVTLLKESYDPTKRDPQFAHAKSSCLWELLLLARHYHPSVVKFAGDILSGASIVYPGDPLRDFTAMNFLDRFCFKNPKKPKVASEAKGAKRDDKVSNAFTRPAPAPYTAVNTPHFLARAAAAGGGTDAVPADQGFLLKYFATKSESDKLKLEKKAKDELVDGTEEEEDAFADELIEKEMRKVEPDGWMDDEDLGSIEGSDDEEDDEEGGAEGADAEGEEGEEGEELDFEGADAPMSDDEVDDEAAAEAAALAEMEGGGAEGSDEDRSDAEDDDDDDEEDFNFDDSDEDDDDEDAARPKGKKDRSASVFASADEFADLLNSANDTGVSVKQSAWEKRAALEDRPKKGGGAGGYKAAPKVSGGGAGKGAKKGGRGLATPEKPSFKQKRKAAEASGGSHKKGGGKKGGGGGGKRQRK